MKEIKSLAKIQIEDTNYVIYVISMHSNFYILHVEKDGELEESKIWVNKSIEGFPSLDKACAEIVTEFKKIRHID